MSNSAYQNRLRDIKYLRQRGKELEAIVELQAQTLHAHGLPCLPSMGVSGDDFITDVNNGDFAFELSTRLKDRNLPLSVDLSEHIEKLWEDTNHGTRREDFVVAYAAGVSACQAIASDIAVEAEEVAHPDSAGWTPECTKRIGALSAKLQTELGRR